MTTELIIYIGRRLSTKGRLEHFYTDIGMTRTFTYKKVLIPAAKVGAIIQLTKDENNFILLQGEHAPKIDTYFDAKEIVADWEARSHADVVNHNRRRREKEMNREHLTPVERAVRTLKSATVDMARADRTAFLAWVIEELR